MAVGAYVRTRSGALRAGAGGYPGGGTEIVARELAAGRSIVQAADRLQEVFPSLDRTIAYEIARQSARRTERAVAAFEAGRRPSLPAEAFRPAAPALFAFRYVVTLTYTDPTTGGTQNISLIRDSLAELSFGELQDWALEVDRLMPAPRMAYGPEGAKEEVAGVPEITFVKAYKSA